MERRTADPEEGYAAWVGFDWGDREHAWVIQWAETGQREQGRLEQTPEALDAWVCQWMSRLHGRRIGGGHRTEVWSRGVDVAQVRMPRDLSHPSAGGRPVPAGTLLRRNKIDFSSGAIAGSKTWEGELTFPRSLPPRSYQTIWFRPTSP